MQEENATEHQHQNEQLLDNVMQGIVKNVTTKLKARLENITLEMNCSHSIVREMSTPAVAKAETVWYPEHAKTEMVRFMPDLIALTSSR